MNIYQFDTASDEGYYSYWMPAFGIDYDLYPELRPLPEEANQSTYAIMLRKQYRVCKPDKLLENNVETLKYVDRIKDLFSFGIEPLASLWTPLEIERIDDSDRRIYASPPSTLEGDFSHCSALIGPPILSSRACEVFRRHFSDTLEFLPLKSKFGEFTAIKVLTFFKAEEVIDLGKSKLVWSLQSKKHTEEGVPRWLQEFKEAYFIETKLKNIFLFRIIESMHTVFVTQPVVDIIEEERLTGAKFIKVYPPPDPNEIRKTAYEKAMKRRKVTNKK